MCLEDQFIKALFAPENKEGSKGLSEELGISENALCSIITRVKKSHPHFIILAIGEAGSTVKCYPNKGKITEVLHFFKRRKLYRY